MPLRQKVIGYEVFYSMTAVEDLDQWQRKTVGLTTSIDLVNLERHAQVSQDLAGAWDAFKWKYLHLRLLFMKKNNRYSWLLHKITFKPA